MIRACEKNDFQMVSHFLDFRLELNETDVSTFKIREPKFKDKMSKSKQKFSLVLGNYLKEPEDLLEEYKLFEATSQPAYLLARFSQVTYNQHLMAWLEGKDDMTQDQTFDPIEEAFRNLYHTRAQATANAEYKKKFHNVKHRSEEFIVKMLNCCENTKEAKLILLQESSMVKELFTTDQVVEMDYPTLELAVTLRHEDFVGHDYCQQILREEWLESNETGNKIQWHSVRRSEKLLYCLSCFLLMLPHAFGYLYTLVFYGGYAARQENQIAVASKTEYGTWKRVWENTRAHFSYPINRFIIHLSVHLFFASFLIAYGQEIFSVDKSNENATGNATTAATPTRSQHQICAHLIFLMTIGFLTTGVIKFCLLIRNWSFEFWNIFSITCHVLLFIAFAKNMGTNCNERTQLRLYGFDSVSCRIMSNSLFGISMTMIVIKFFYFLQLNTITGPVAISLRKVIKSVSLVFICFIIMLVSFGIGNFYLMKYLHVNRNFHDGKPVTIYNIGDNLYWSLYDLNLDLYGERGQVEEVEARYTAMFLFGAFLMFNVLILMNALIALMNNTLIDTVANDKVKRWKFERTVVWLGYIDSVVYLPSPFNLFELLILFARKSVRCCTSWCTNSRGTKRNSDKDRENYIDLLDKIKVRYLAKEEDCVTNTISREDVKNLMSELIREKK